MNLDDIMKKEIWSMKDIALYIGKSVSGAYAFVSRTPNFPKEINLGDAHKRWNAKKVRAWFLNR